MLIIIIFCLLGHLVALDDPVPPGDLHLPLLELMPSDVDVIYFEAVEVPLNGFEAEKRVPFLGDAFPPILCLDSAFFGHSPESELPHPLLQDLLFRLLGVLVNKVDAGAVVSVVHFGLSLFEILEESVVSVRVLRELFDLFFDQIPVVLL